MADILMPKKRIWLTQPPVGTPLNRAHPLCQGLVGCWPMNEGAGKRLNDLSRSNGGSLGTVSPKWNPLSVGTSLKFSGTTDLAQIPYTQALAFGRATPFTISFRISFAAFTASNRIIMQGINPYPWNIRTGLASAASLRILQFNGSASVTSESPATLVVNREYKVSFTNTGTHLIVYVDGVPNTPVPILVSGSCLTDRIIDIGYDTSGSNSAAFSMSGLLIHNRPLSPLEIKSLYENPYQIYMPRTYWVCSKTGMLFYANIDGVMKAVKIYGNVDGMIKELQMYGDIGGVIV